jgi:hypothetical protein
MRIDYRHEDSYLYRRYQDVTTDSDLYEAKPRRFLYKMDTNMTILNQFPLTGNIRA